MSMGFEVLRALSDQELDDHARQVTERLEELDTWARMSCVGLPRDKHEERKVLQGHHARIEEEQLRRKDQAARSLDVATAFHEELPEMLEVLKSGNAVVLARYLHDRTDSELDLLAANGRTVAELAERIVTFRAGTRRRAGR